MKPENAETKSRAMARGLVVLGLCIVAAFAVTGCSDDEPTYTEEPAEDSAVEGIDAETEAIDDDLIFGIALEFGWDQLTPDQQSLNCEVFTVDEMVEMLRVGYEQSESADAAPGWNDDLARGFIAEKCASLP